MRQPGTCRLCSRHILSALDAFYRSELCDACCGDPKAMRRMRTKARNRAHRSVLTLADVQEALAAGSRERLAAERLAYNQRVRR